jgi:DNA-binding transcriptional MerR regulator
VRVFSILQTEEKRKMVREFSIGDIARMTGVKVPTIRYYENIGIMLPPPRTGGGQRRYDEAALDRLAFVAHAREMGFPLDSIRSLLDLAEHPSEPCANADRIARERLADVVKRIERLENLRTELEAMLDGHQTGKAADCRIIEVLSDHGECMTDH